MKNSPLYYKVFENKNSDKWVVFIHGAGGSSTVWFKQLKTFRRNFNVLLLDLRGHGKSRNVIKEWKTNKYTFKDISEDVIEVMDSINLSSAHFVGISLGTIIIRNIAELYPERVESMILGGAIIRFNIRSKILIAIGNMVKRFIPYMWIYKLYAWILMPKKRHKESRLVFVREAKKLYQKEFIRWVRLTSEVKPLMRFFREKETDVPTLYLMGDEDYMFLPGVKAVVERHKKAVLRIIKNSGHVCNIDQPSVFNALAIKFIKNHGEFFNKKEEIVGNV